MKNFSCFIGVLLSAHCLLANTLSQSDEDIQNNRRENYSNIGTCARSIDEIGSGDVVPALFNVTVRHYCDFLNAVAADDPHHLYDEQIRLDHEDVCIVRAGLPGNYSYSVIEGKGEDPITFVSWFDQARYCNWLENGQPRGAQSKKTTEDGVYTLNGDKVVVVNPGTTYLLKGDVEGNISPQLMMESAVIEGAAKALKRELGISGEKESFARPSEFTEDFTNSATFTIIQNNASSSNTFSPSHQSIDPALKEQTQRAIEKVIAHSSTQLQDHYKKADEAWIERDRGWQEHSRLGHALQESRKKLTLSEQKLEQATQAITSEELEKTRLGKIAKYAGIAGDALGHVPELHAQVVSAGVSKLAGFADTINTAWAKVNLALARREHQQVNSQYEQIQGQKDQAYQRLLPLERRAEEIELLDSTQAEKAIKKLAEQLHPQIDWRESQWQAWVNLISPEWSDKEKLHLLEQARLNPNWIKEGTKKSWEQKIEIGKEQHIAVQKKANLATLKRHYENDCDQHDRAKAQEEQQRRYLDQSQNSIVSLKHEIEKRVDELEQLETRDKIQFEQKKKEFIEKLKELEKTQQRNQGLQRKWEEAVQLTSNQGEQRFNASITYDNVKKEVERILARVKKAYQTDRELLQKIWLKSASSNYKDWSLPEIGVSQPMGNALDSIESARKSEECEPPVQRLEEIEARGRNLRLREAMMTSSITGKSTVLTAILHPFSKQPSLTKQPSSLYSTSSNLDQVKEWVKQRQDHPKAQDQERWVVLEKLDQLQAEIRTKKKELKDDPSMEEPMRKSNEMDGGDDDGKSRFSTATKQTVSSKSSSASSTLSASKSSVFSFGGGTLFGGSKKQSGSPLSVINEEPQDPQEKLKQLQTQASELKKKYFELLEQAENERTGSRGQEAAMSFSEETDRNYAWEEADRKSVAAIQKKRREEELEKIAQEEQESWQTNTERWRARDQADQALKSFRRAQQRTLKLGEEADKAKTKTQLTEADRKKKEALVEEEKLKQVYFTAEEAWEKIVQEYHGDHTEQNIGQEKEKSNEEVQEQANERLKEKDRAVNRRWEKLLKSYQNSELTQSAVEQEELGEAIMALEGQLEQAYQDSFITYSGQEALPHYREVAFQRALENARNHPEAMVEAWEKIATAKEKVTAGQLEINKQASEVFKKEAKRLEKIEKIWKGILEREQQEGKQIREQAAQEYYRGNHSDWHSLREQERTRYNNEANKANEEYDQKIEEKKNRLTFIETRLPEIEKSLEIVRNKRKGDWRASSAKRHDQQLIDFGEEKTKLGNEKKELQQYLAQQETTFNLGKRARQKENYYEALTQAQWTQEQAKEQNGKNPYWEKAAECYRKASTYWQKTADDKNLSSQSNEKIAKSYGNAAEAYEKAAQENAVLLTTHNRSKEALIKLYKEKGNLYEQLVQEQEKGEDISDIQETLYQLEKKIERYLGTRGAQIEELQENLPLLQKRSEELAKEIGALHQQGKEAIASKKETLVINLRELIASSQKALEDLLQEVPESSERAAMVLTTIQSHKTKDQQLQQAIEQTLQLEAKMVPWEQGAALLPSETKTAHSRGELFLANGQQSLALQLNQVLEQARKIKEQLLAQTEGSADMTAQFQTCMSTFQQLEKQDHYLKQIAPQLQHLDHNKTVLTARVMTLKNDIKTAQHQGETFLFQGQEKLLSNATKLLSEIDPMAEQLLAGTGEAAEQAKGLLFRGARFQEEDKALQENSLSLREFGQKKNSLQKCIEALTKEITLSQSRGEALLGEGQQQLLHDTAQVLSAIEQTSKKILEGDSDASEQGIALRSQLKQLEERDQALKKNAPTLLSLEQKKNGFQARLKQLTAEISTSNNKTYLNEAQESLAREMIQLLSRIDQNAKQLLTSASEASVEAQTLLTQLEELVQRDQQLQQNAPDLEKLDEQKKFFQNRVEKLTLELKSSQHQQHHLAIEKQRLLTNEINQALAKIDQCTQQLVSGTVGAKEETQIVLSELSSLEQRDQRLQQHFTLLRDLTQKESPLKIRAEALENEIITSQIRGEITLAQAQKTLLEEINKILHTTSQTANQLLSEDQGSSEPSFQDIRLLSKLAYADEVQGADGAQKLSVQKLLDASSTGATKQFAAGVEFEAKSIKELIPLLDGLLVKDERLQENALSLRNLEQKKKLLRERIETLKTEITSSEKIGEPLLAQQQQTLLETLQQALDKASDTTTQLMAGAEHASEQAKAFFNEVDQLQHHDQQLKENIAKVQELQQKKKILQQRLSTLSEEMKATQDQREVLIAQSQQVLADKVTKMLPRIEATIELLRKGTIEVLPTAERANTLLVEIIELEQRDYGFQQNIPVLRECIEKGLFLHTHIVQLKEKIAIGHSSQDKGEQFIAQGQQKLLDAFQEAQPHIEDMVKQLLAGSKEASEQAKALLTQIKQLEQREKSFQKNIPTLLELEQKRVSLQTRMEALKNEIVLSTNREEILITQYQQALLEAIQRAMDHASECITQLIDGINDTPEKIEAQKKVQIEQLAKITTAEKTLQEIEKKETERAAELASVAWNNAVEIARQADEANVLASRTKTERSYNEVHRLAQDAKNAWVKTLEAQKIIFSKTSEQDKRLLDIKIKMSTSRIEQYDQLAIEALKNAKEAVSIAQEMATAAWDKAIELHDRAKQIKDEAETIKTEHAYIQMANADKAAGDAWGVALEAKKALLSKGGESDRPDLFAEIETAERRKEAYAKRVLVGLEKAQAAGRVAAENSKLQLETREKIIKLTSQIEEAKQASKEKSYRKNVFDYIATKLEQARDNWNKVSELLGQGKREKSALWRKAAEASEASAEVLSRAVQDDISRQKDDRCESLEEKIWNAYHLSDASTWSLKSEEALEKVNQVPNKGRDFWRNLAQQYQVAADYKKNAVKFSDYIGPWDSNYAGMCAHSSADYQVKAAEAQEAGNLILAGGYREAAETLRKAVEQYQQAIRACTSKREREGMCWSSVGNSLELQADYQVKSAEYQIKASEAQKTGKITLVAGYREAAETLQKAREALNQYAEQNQQAALDEAAGKKPDVIYSWKYKGRSLEAMASYQVKAIEAQDVGKTILANGYRDAAETLRKAEEQYQQSIRAQVSKKERFGHSLDDVGISLEFQADYQTKAAEAQDAGKTTLAAGYREAVEITHKVVEQYQQSAQAYVAGKDSEGLSWIFASRSLKLQADCQVKEAQAQEAGYLEAVSTYQHAAEQYKQAAKVYTAGKKDEGESWNKVGGGMELQAGYQMKAAEAQKAGRVMLAAGYREAVETIRKAVEQYKQEALDKAAGKESKGLSWIFASRSLKLQADCQVKAAQAQEAGYIEIAATYQCAAEKCQQAVKVYATGKNDEGNSLDEAGKVLDLQADYQMKEIEAQEAGRRTLAAGYRGVAEILQKAVEQYQQSIRAHTSRKETEGESLKNVGDSLKLQANYQAKAVEAQEAGKIALATGYREAVEITRKIAEQYQQEALDRAAGKESSYYNVCSSLKSQAEYQIKAAQAHEAGQTTLAAGYREAAENKRKAADQYKLSTQRDAAGKTEESRSWATAGHSFFHGAKKLVKAIESEIAGKPEIARKYREAVEQYKRSVESSAQAARAYAAGNAAEGYRLHMEGQSFYSAATAIAVKAENGGR